MNVVSVHSFLWARQHLSLSCISMSDLSTVVGCVYLLSLYPPPSNTHISWKIDRFFFFLHENDLNIKSDVIRFEVLNTIVTKCFKYSIKSNPKIAQ